MRKVWLGIALLIGHCGNLQAQYARMYLPILTPPLPEVRRVTSHPQNDLDPALSPDGRWLVFVSDRAGNRDIWIKPVAGGQAFPLTTHQADDYSPCWGADNHTIYFISTRSDAEGDLWQIQVNPAKLPNTKIILTQLDDYLGYDGEPACSPDGKWLAYTSTRGSKQRNVWLFDRRRRLPYPFTRLGGLSPAWSADGQWLAYVVIHSDWKPQSDILVKRFEPQALKGEIPPEEDRGIPITNSPAYESFPVWARQGERLFFLSHEWDTNRDGRIDLEDNPSLICLDLSVVRLDSLNTLLQAGLPVTAPDDLPLQHLTPIDRYSLYPAVTLDHLYLAGRVDQQFDIWELPNSGMIPKFSNAQEQYTWANTTFPLHLIEQLLLDQDSTFQAGWRTEQPRFNSLRLLALQSLLERFPDSQPWSKQAALTVAVEWLKIGQRLPALRLLRQLLQQTDNSDSVYALGKIAFWQATGLEQTSLLDSLTALAEQYSNNPELINNIVLLTAAVAESDGRLADALAVLQKPVAVENQMGENYWRRLQKDAEIYRQFQRTQESLADYLRLLQSTDSEYWRQTAVQNILQLLQDAAPGADKATVLQNASRFYAANRYLAAELHVRLAESLWQSRQSQQALAELNQVAENFSEQRLANLKAANLAVDIYRQSRQLDEAIAIFQRLLQRTDLQDLEKSYLREQIWNLRCQIAQQQQRQQNFNDATALYRTLLQADSSRIEAQRGLIYCAAVQQQLPALAEEYRNRLRKNPNDAVVLYCLGLIYSDLYLNNASGLLQANRYLEQALALDYGMIYGYLTLSANYERLEGLQQQRLERHRSWFVRSGRQLFAPVIWLYRTVTLRKAAQLQNWYERAIAMLDLALKVNNERQQPQLEAALCNQLGNVYFQMGESGYENAYLNYCRKLELDTAFTDPEEEAVYYQRLGNTAILTGRDWTRAESALKKAIALNDKLNHPAQVLSGQKSLARCYQLSGQYQAANEILAGTLSRDPKKDDRAALVESYRNLAYNSLLLGDEAAVRRTCLQALEILQEQKNKKAKHPSTAIRFEFIGYSIPVWNLGNLGANAARSLYGFSSEDEQALVYTILAQNAVQQKDIRQAIHLLIEKLAVFRHQGEMLGQAITLNNLGMMHLALGNNEDAWRWFMLSYERCRKENYLGGEITNLINLSQLAVIFWQRNQLDGKPPAKIRVEPQKLLNYQQEVMVKIQDYPLTFLKERVELHHQHAILTSLLLFDEIAAAQNSGLPPFLRYDQRLGSLIEEFETAADLARRNFLPRQQAIIYKNLGDFLARMALAPEAEEYLQKALAFAQDEGFRDLEWRILLALGDLHPISTDSTGVAAADYYEQARSILLQEWEFNRENSLSQMTGIETESLYQRLLAAAVVSQQPEDALRYLDELTTYQRLQQFYQVDFTPGKDERRLEQEQYFQLIRAVNLLQNRVHEIRQGRLGGYKLYYQIMDSLNLVQQELRMFVQTLREKDPELLALLQPIEFTVAEIQQRLKPQQAVLIFHPMPAKLYSWCITSDNFYFSQSNLTDSLLTRLVGHFNDLLRLNLYSTSLSDSLVKAVLSPVLAQAKSAFEWMIIADRALAQLPFELLQVDHDWLNNQQAVYYNSSVTDLLLGWDYRREIGDTLVWIGNLRDKQFSTRFTVRLLEPLRTTEAQFRAALPTADYLILNRPVTRVPQPLLQSYYRFQLPSSPSSTLETIVSAFPADNDGFFYLRDWLAQTGKAVFCFMPVVFDSGWSAPAAHSVLQTAWRCAGMPAMVSLRWSIPADAIDQFSQFFFEGITEMPPQAAFRNARLKIQQLYPNPRHWGAFVWRGGLPN